jgi:multidrug efflux pump subunit AcrA (membrane-fusion protein)
VTRKLLTVLALAAVAAVATAANSQSPATSTRSIVIESATVELIDDVDVPATDAGMLMALHVKEGQAVEAEALLADIDNREILAKRRIAEGELSAAQKQAESQAEIEVARAAVRVSEQELASVQEIRNRSPGAVSVTELRKYEFQLERAQAQLKQALNENLIAHITVDVKQAQLDATAIELDRRQVKSMFKGEVDRIIKRRGEWVQAGEPILRLVAFDRLRVIGDVYASMSSPVEVMGKPVVITFYSAGGKQHTVRGSIGFASSIIDGTGDSRRFRVWAEIDNEKLTDPVTRQASWKIQPGTSVTMTIDLTPPPPPRPVAPGKAEPGKGGITTKLVPPAPGSKVDSFKPVLTGPGSAPAGAAKSEPIQATAKSDDGKAPESKTKQPAAKER